MDDLASTGRATGVQTFFVNEALKIDDEAKRFKMLAAARDLAFTRL